MKQLRRRSSCSVTLALTRCAGPGAPSATHPTGELARPRLLTSATAGSEHGTGTARPAVSTPPESSAPAQPRARRRSTRSQVCGADSDAKLIALTEGMTRAYRSATDSA